MFLGAGYCGFDRVQQVSQPESIAVSCTIHSRIKLESFNIKATKKNAIYRWTRWMNEWMNEWMWEVN